MKKYISILIILVLFFIEFTPIVKATENVQRENNSISDANVMLEDNNDDNNIFENNIDNNESDEYEDYKKTDELEENDTYNKEENEINLQEDKIEERVENYSYSKNESNNIDEENNEKEKQEEHEILSRSVLNTEKSEFLFSVTVDENIIKPYEKEGTYYLFLPSTADLSNLVIDYIGDVTSVTEGVLDNEEKKIQCSIENESSLTIITENEEEYNVVIMKSDVPSIFVNLDNNTTIDTVNNNSKDIKYPGSVRVTGCTDLANNISQSGIEFKGRGNTTWAMPKRGYQIKLKSKSNFLGIGSSKEKKWVLIANYNDPTLLKNKIVNDLCVKTKLSTCPNSDFADLYVNGEYIGNYLVCDKIEINSKRVKLTNEKGVLVEIDGAYYNEEEYWFKSNRNMFYTVKESVSEDNLTIKMAMNAFKNSLNELENELYSSNPSWQKVASMIDVESFAKYYLVNEFAIEPDSYFSSCYMYKDGENDVIHMGPTWDYDVAFAYHGGVYADPNCDFTIEHSYSNVMQRLMRFPQFATIVDNIYENEVKPALEEISVSDLTESHKYSAKMNTIAWSKEKTYNNQIDKLNTFIEKRKNYFCKRYSNKQLEYTAHVENEGWLTSIQSGVCGTEGKSLKMEAIMVSVGSGYGKDVSVSYRAHVQDIGWQDWVSNGDIAGTKGKNLRMEAIQLKLNNLPDYSIRYRVHIQNVGWSDWVYDGNIAGTEGRALRLEAIEIQIVKKQGLNKNSLINYNGHVENIGDTAYVPNGAIVGTTGRGLRLEGMSIVLNKDLIPNVGLSINEHIENIGWVRGLTDKDYIGTKGQGLRLEAFSIKLTGADADKYTVRYRAHVQDIGWQKWSLDGQIAGTEGQSKRIEAIQIEIKEK